MENLTKSQRKKIINHELKEFFAKQEIKKYNSWDNGYEIRKYFADCVYLGNLFFPTIENAISYGYSLSINVVEDIILEIQHPNKNFTTYLTKEDVLSTIHLSYFKEMIRNCIPMKIVVNKNVFILLVM